jgi:3-phenylpropionate/trans-cinnamate dioxygenase ferredoxin subunit
MTSWHDVAAVHEVRRAGHVIVRVGGREIGVLAAPGGRLLAVRNRCPHHGAPLCLGAVMERTTGTPGRYAASDRLVLRCPWHGWEFDVADGRCVDEPAMRAAVYPVRVAGDRVLIEA